MNLQAFGEQLQTMRKRAGLSQERLADTLDRAARCAKASARRSPRLNRSASTVY
jgi:transcriptional regulator with XRE-family HTH domain